METLSTLTRFLPHQLFNNTENKLIAQFSIKYKINQTISLLISTVSNSKSSELLIFNHICFATLTHFSNDFFSRHNSSLFQLAQEQFESCMLAT